MPRLLIVDDSSSARELLLQVLSSDGEIEVVGVAKNGREAVMMTQELEPDVITMDIHMPDMNGFEATKEIMIERPTPIVIVSASASVKDVDWAMRSLQVGALMLRPKPAGPGSPDFDQRAKELIETVKAMADVKVISHIRPHPRNGSTTSTPAVPQQFQVVAMAASTGGPRALHHLLGALPPDFSVPILIVQHMAEGFSTGFAAWLDTNIDLPVQVAEHGESMEPGVVYVAPESKHLGVTRARRLVLSEDPPIGGFRPSATHLFASCAGAFGSGVVGVILTGMGTDGVEGLKSIEEAGGATVVQDERTCVVFGMPGAAVAEGVAQKIIPLDQMANHLMKLAGRST